MKTLMARIVAGMLSVSAPQRSGLKDAPIAEKPCVQCGKMKRHNNAYCSAECCKAHRSKA